MKKNYNFRLVLIMFLAALAWGAITRPDIKLAMYAIENAYRYPEDDMRVSIASEYLITTEVPESYEWLVGLFRTSRNVIEGPNDPPDYTAIQGAYILGSYQDGDSLNVMLEILTRDYSPEGPPNSVYFIFDGLKLKEDGYLQIMSIANNIFVTGSIRRSAIHALGESGDIGFVAPLINIAQTDDNHAIRAAAVRALAVLGTSSAFETIKYLSVNDPHEYVRGEASRVLENISQ